jgi:hypothetical protein
MMDDDQLQFDNRMIGAVRSEGALQDACMYSIV